MRVFLIGRNYQPTGIGVADAGWRYSAWLMADANPVLMKLRQRWLREPSDWRAAEESAAGLGCLGAGVFAVWWRPSERRGGDRQVQP